MPHRLAYVLIPSEKFQCSYEILQLLQSGIIQTWKTRKTWKSRETLKYISCINPVIDLILRRLFVSRLFL